MKHLQPNPLPLSFSLSVLLALLLFSTFATGQSLVPLGKWSEGVCMGVAIKGSTLYYTNGTWIEAVDISDPGNIQVVGRLDLGKQITGLHSEGPALYSEVDRNLVVVDVPDQSAPVSVTYTDIRVDFLSHSGAYLIAGRWAELDLIDISDHMNPVVVATIEIEDEQVMQGWVEGTLLIISTRGAVHFYDISDPATPTYLNGIQHINTRSFTLENDYLYLSADSLYVYDVSDGASPVRLSATDAYANSLVVIDGWLFGYSLDGWIESFNISDPTRPLPIHLYQPEPSGMSFFPGSGFAANADGLVYLSDAEFGIHGVDITDPARMVGSVSIPTGGAFRYMEVSGDKLLVSSPTNGVRLFDISDPADIRLKSRYSDLNKALMTETVGATTYVAAQPSAVLRYENDSLVKIADIPVSAQVIEVVGEWAYLALGKGRIFDISNPSEPISMGSFDSIRGEKSWDIASFGTLLFVAEGQQGVSVFDISDADSPAKVGVLDIPGRIEGMHIHKGQLFVASWYKNVHIVDAAAPFESEIVNLPESVGFYDFASMKGALVGMHNWKGVLWYNEDATPPAFESLADAPAKGVAIQTKGDIVFTLSSHEGVRSYRLEGIASGQEQEIPADDDFSVAIYPNPSIGSVAIHLELAEKSDVEVSIVDIMGREIDRVHQGLLYAGSHTLRWSGLEKQQHRIAPGVYFALMRFSGFTRTYMIIRH